MEERRLILAFALSFAVLLGFRMWTNSRYPQDLRTQNAGQSQNPTQAPNAPEPPAEMLPNDAPAKAPAQAAPRPVLPVVTGEERRVEVVTESAEVAFSTRGARLLSWKLLQHMDSRGKPVEAHPGGDPDPGPLDLVTGKKDVDARIREGVFRSTPLDESGEKGARFDFSDGSIEVTKTLQSIRGGRAFRVEAEVRQDGESLPVRVFWGPGFGQPTEDEKGITGYLPPGIVEIDERGAEHRLPATSLVEPRTGRVRLVGVEVKYFAAIIAREDGGPVDAVTGSVKVDGEPHVQMLVTPPVALTVEAKDYDRQKEIGLGGERIVPVGSWIGPIVVPLTRGLRAVNARVGNYGIAIILLTIGISLAMAPLRHYAILSSAKMAKVGPQIRAVQERYKRLSLTDPKRQQMQKEIAEVYEKNGIDMVKQTAAGCLPTLLTMPFLFAFYRMLDISVDLKGAPFFWIPDLSLKDPLFITPILSGISMIAMQRIMPTPSVDPAQQRIMMMMPIIFSVMFAWAPAGLNLYWFVSNLAAVVQQVLIMYFAPQHFPRPKPAS